MRFGLAEVRGSAAAPHWLVLAERITALGSYTREGCLDPAACRRTLQIIKEYLELSHRYQVRNLLAVATQAVRGARNGPAFLRQVEAETGLQLQVLTPREEALLVWRGLLGLLPPAQVAIWPKAGFDLGGGSLEWLWQAEGQLPQYLSLPLSPVALATAWQAADPPSPQDLARLQQEVEKLLAPVRRHQRERPPPALLLGSGGAATTLAALYWQERQLSEPPALTVLSPGELDQLLARLVRQTRAERARNPLLGEVKGALIIPAALVIRALLRPWPGLPLTISQAGLLEGLVSQLSETETSPA